MPRFPDILELSPTLRSSMIQATISFLLPACPPQLCKQILNPQSADLPPKKPSNFNSGGAPYLEYACSIRGSPGIEEVVLPSAYKPFS